MNPLIKVNCHGHFQFPSGARISLLATTSRPNLLPPPTLLNTWYLGLFTLQ